MNESRRQFTFIDAGHIRFGLQAIKGLGDGPIHTIREAVKEKRFTSIYDFIERTGGDVINKKSLESLILSGALDAFGDRAELLASIQKMSAYQKEIEAKKATSQMGLFDMGSDERSEDRVHFDLEHARPMTFEERMKGEKSIIGYPVSGHPLDGIEEFVKAKSKNIGIIYDWIEKKASTESLEAGGSTEILDEAEKTEEISVILRNEESAPIISTIATQEAVQVSEKQNMDPTGSDDENLNSPAPIDADDTYVPTQAEELQHMAIEKVKEESIFATLIGLVHDVRKMQTKSGAMMLMATVESVGFDFKLVIFPRDYEVYEKKVIEDMIVVVDGRLKFDTERDEISISPG